MKVTFFFTPTKVGFQFVDMGNVSIRCYGDEKLKVWHIHSYVRTYLPIIVPKKSGLDAMKIKATKMLPFVFCVGKH